MAEPVLDAFAQRLAQVCRDLGLPAARGRATALAKTFDVTPNAAKKWLSGAGTPELVKAIEIATKANVNVNWLLQGFGEKRSVAASDLSRAVGQAIGALQADDKLEIADFVRYKLERATSVLVAGEERKKYLGELDRVLNDRHSK
jgi:hypothetical protein